MSIEFTGERVVPWRMGVGAAGLMRDHAARYALALPMVAGRMVVDLGCGTGYGAFMLAWVARQVIGIDHCEEALAFGRLHFEAGNLTFRNGNLERLVVLPGAEVYVAFEVLEHLDNPVALIRLVRGALIWSVPVDCASEFHRQVYSLEEACRLVPGSEIWYQAEGQIVRRERADFAPVYVCGVRPG